MRLLPTLALLAWANVLADARGEYLERYDTDSIDCHDSNKNHEPRGVSALWDDDVCPHSSPALNDDARDHGLVKRWQQWVRRADATTNAAAAQATEDEKDDSKESEAAETKDAAETNDAETKDAETKAAETTQEEKPTEAEKTTEVKETKAETTQKEETKEESTVEQPTVPSVTVPSPTLPTQTLPTETESEDSATTEQSSSDEMTETSYISSDQTTYSTYSSEKIGASCFSTTVEHTSFCSTRTRDGQIETHGCTDANITSSACAPGMLCTTHPDSGNDVCMRLHNEVGTAGIIIASIFGFLGAACTFTMVFICYSDKRAAANFKNKRPPKTSESARLLAKAPTPPTPPALRS
ncbi:hypothetical protein CEP54_002140 [Fusarium duplospermum]|uniref:Uncharacterized protein n=1 Tax=Fusarium duplospermum TaxID=1325734 RepID=A0A428QWM3_9HYPO|nr:hypothetical protein CEP54_002140 [Fusarium duplospermum]